MADEVLWTTEVTLFDALKQEWNGVPEESNHSLRELRKEITVDNCGQLLEKAHEHRYVFWLVANSNGDVCDRRPCLCAKRAVLDFVRANAISAMCSVGYCRLSHELRNEALTFVLSSLPLKPFHVLSPL